MVFARFTTFQIQNKLYKIKYLLPRSILITHAKNKGIPRKLQKANGPTFNKTVVFI